MLGIIGVEALEVHCSIGCYPEEKLAEQKLLLDLKVEVDIGSASKTDQLLDTISYSDLAKVAIKVAQRKHHHLIETLAMEILETLFTEQKIVWVYVKIRKPGAIPEAQTAFIELERHR